MTRTQALLATLALGMSASSPAWAYWRTNVMKNQHDRYNALIEHVNQDGNVDETIKVGEYENKGKAKKAAKKAAKSNNQEDGIMVTDPICEQANVPC